MTSKTRYKLQEVLFIILYWIGAGNLYILIRYSGSTNALVEIGLGEIENIFLWATLASFCTGAGLGILEIFIYPRFTKKKSFAISIVYRTIIFISLLVLIIMISLCGVSYLKGFEISEGLILSLDFFLSRSFFILLLYMVIIGAFMNFILFINRRSGPGVILNMIKGKYHHPIEEERIFMFLDLQSSSKIAEELGHIKFSKFIQDCFSDLSDILLTYHASIYQFVGDEAVLTWRKQNGLKNINCIIIFFEFERLLLMRQDYYMENYNHKPIFKASLHGGYVTVAEVGSLKTEVAYHGDVLNTAARIQGLCNIYNQKLLVTESIVEIIDSRCIQAKYIDEVKLRGKKNKEKIFTLHTHF
tara:strand:- start:8482 stop:9555 length:1074 start_codon:yes stop_codon:yes gene_type:complete